MSAEPWGFAPFHYGRWAEIEGRWGWVPGGGFERGARFERPVYAPALVAFFGLGGERERREVGWVPLGPGEAYYPPYRVGDRYLRAVNRFDVRNDADLRRDRRADEIAIDRFLNRRAAVVVPAAIMVESRRLRGTAQRLAPERLAELHPLIGRHPLEPTLATAGVTPRVARELHLEGEPRPHGPEAPGPRIEAMEFGRPRGPGERHALPPLRQANVHPGAPLPMERARPETAGEAERRPAEVGPGGLPALRPPNARPGEPGERGRNAMLPGEARPHEGERAPGERGPNAMLPSEARPHEGERAPGERGPNAMLPGEPRPHERGPNTMLPGEVRPHEGERAPGERGPNAMLPGEPRPRERGQTPCCRAKCGHMKASALRANGGRTPCCRASRGRTSGGQTPRCLAKCGHMRASALRANGGRMPCCPGEPRPHERGPNVTMPGDMRSHEGERPRGGVVPNAFTPPPMPGQRSVPFRHEAFAEPPIHVPHQRPEQPAFRPMPAPHMAAPVAMHAPMAPPPHFAPPPAAHFAPAPHFAPPAPHVAPPPHGGPGPHKDDHH